MKGFRLELGILEGISGIGKGVIAQWGLFGYDLRLDPVETALYVHLCQQLIYVK